MYLLFILIVLEKCLLSSYNTSCIVGYHSNANFSSFNEIKSDGLLWKNSRSGLGNHVGDPAGRY